MDNKIKIVIVDDHPILVEGLKELLDNIADFQVLYTASNGEDLLNKLKEDIPDVILMDVNMPGMNGIDCTKKVKELYPVVKVIILTMYNERTIVNQLMQAGADGCLLKSNGSKELVEAIRRVSENKSYFDTFKDFIKEDHNNKGTLSSREIDIIRLIAKGLTNFEIAEKLFISENTVKTHRKNILRKLELTGTSQLTLYAISNHLI